MKILFLTSRFPYPPHGGDRLRVYNLIRELSKHHKITLISLLDKPIAPAHRTAMMPYLHRCETVHLSGFKSYLNCLNGLFSAKPLQVHYYYSKVFQNTVARLNRREKFDVAICHLLRTAELISHFNATTKILDLTDALRLNYQREQQLKGNFEFSPKYLAQNIEQRRLIQYEKSMLEKFDHALLISEIDKNYLAKFYDVSNVHIVPAGVDCDYFKMYESDYDPNNIVFTGKLSTEANLDAIFYFMREILPQIKQKAPSVHVTIVGIEAPYELVEMDKRGEIQLQADTEDVRPFLRRAAVSICPMRIGAGSKNKVLEAMASGTAVVSTSIGVEGLQLSTKDGVSIADAPKDFAEAVLTIMRDRTFRRRLIYKARRVVEQHFTWKQAARPLLELIENSCFSPIDQKYENF